MPNEKSPCFDNREKYIELGYNIAYYRKHAKLTQEQLAEKVGISRQHMGAIEAPNLCRPISLDLLFNLASALEVEPYKLLQFREWALNIGRRPVWREKIKGQPFKKRLTFFIYHMVLFYFCVKLYITWLTMTKLLKQILLNVF